MNLLFPLSLFKISTLPYLFLSSIKIKKLAQYYLIIFAFSFNFLEGQGGFRSRVFAQNSINHETMDVFETYPGNYLGLGVAETMQNGVYRSMLAITGINAIGQVMWMKTYGDTILQFAYSPFASRTSCKKGNYIYYTGIVIQKSKQFGILMKFNYNGDLIWQKFYKDSLDDILPQKVSPSVDGGFLITGFINDWINNTQPTLLIKTDSFGQELWRKKINKPFPNASDGKGVAQDSLTKKIIVVGYQYIGNSTSWSPFDQLLIVDSIGNFLSRHTFTDGHYSDIIPTKDGKFVATGEVVWQAFIPYHLSFVKKFDVNFPASYVWRIHNFGPITHDNGFNAVAELANGDLVVAGHIDSLEETDLRANPLTRILRISSQGQIISTKCYNYASNDSTNNYQYCKSITGTSDGGYLASIVSVNGGNNPLFYVKFDGAGCDSTTYYCRTVGISNPEKEKEEVLLYPNPSNSILNVEMNFRPSVQSCDFQLKILNSLGQILFTSKKLEQHSVIDVSSFPRGIYIVQLYNKGIKLTTNKFIKE